MTLHITNGDAAAALIGASGLGGLALPWRDVLHEGPIPAALPLAELSDLRARHLAGCGWGTREALAGVFRRRDGILAGWRDHAEVVLWFEHDLYDQLQLLQLLDWFSGQVAAVGRVSLVCIGAHPGVEPFHGLGQLTPAQIADLRPTGQRVTTAQLALGRAGWASVRSTDPTAVEVLLAGDTSSLPFLAGALRRHLEEFPWTGTGLSRTEAQILRAIAADRRGPLEVFEAVSGMEERRFLGDWQCWRHLGLLTAGPRPLARTTSGGPFVAPPRVPADAGFRAQSIVLTADGEDVLASRADALALRPLDTWRGGVHLRPGAPGWRWDPGRGALACDRSR